MILVAYASKHGSSKEVAEHIAKRLQEKGQKAEAKPAAEIKDLGKPDAVVIGSGLYQGAWLPEATAFARKNQAVLATVPTWLFSVGPLGKDVKDDKEQPVELAELRDRLKPRHHVVFRGVLDYGKLDHGERMTMKAAGASEGDFREWDAITAWADGIAKALG